MKNEMRRQTTACLIKEIYLSDNQVNLFIALTQQEIEALGQRVKTGNKLAQAKAYLVSEDFLSNFTHLFQDFSDEEIQDLIKVYQSIAMKKFLTIAKYSIKEFFEKARELFIEQEIPSMSLNE